MGIYLSEFIQFLVNHKQNGDNRLPTLVELSEKLGVSVASLREQMEVARILGFIEVKPKLGIRQKEYSFTPAVLASAGYAIAQNPDAFQYISNLRMHLEEAYWNEAVALLTQDDFSFMRNLVETAKRKLHGKPIQIPHLEHKQLHLKMFNDLNNPFVSGLLECYWEMYEAVGLNLYSDLGYLESIWDYHERIVDALEAGEISLKFSTYEKSHAINTEPYKGDSFPII